MPTAAPSPRPTTVQLLVATPDPPALPGDWRGLARCLATADHRREDFLALEDWLLALHGVPVEAEPALAAARQTLAGRGHGWLRIDALSLVISRDRLVALPQQPEDAADAVTLIDEVMRQMPVVGALQACGGQRLLDLDAPAEARFAPAWRTAGRPLDEHLPQGPRGAEWRRWLTEAQMLLHEHPLNAAREVRGLRPINALWLAGGAATAPLPQALDIAFYGEHPLATTLLLAGLGQTASAGEHPTEHPASHDRMPERTQNATRLSVWIHRPGEPPPVEVARLLASSAFELRILEPSGQQCYIRRPWHVLRLWRRPLLTLTPRSPG